MNSNYTYIKPANLKYTDMAIFIDSEVYSENPDVERIFEYLYHISFMLAQTGMLFDTRGELDEFAVFSANYMWKRYQSKKSAHIKSVLNYLKSQIRNIRASYYNYIGDKNTIKSKEYNSGLKMSSNSFSYNLESAIHCYSKSEFTMLLEGIAPTIKSFMKTIRYKPGTSEYLNIYISCLLSILNRMTISNRDINHIQSLGGKIWNSMSYVLDDIYDVNREDFVILYHLPDSMYNYISVIVKKLYHLISYDLSTTIYEENCPEALIKNVICNSIWEKREDEDVS